MASVHAQKPQEEFCAPRWGWYCTYAAGHLGECDDWPESWNWFNRKRKGCT